MNNQWTADYVRHLKESRGYLTTEAGWQAVADAHNAALAANDHKWNLARLKDIKEVTDKAAQQLAAERAKPKTTEYAQGWDDHVAAARSQREELQEQVATERKQVATLVERIKELEASK